MAGIYETLTISKAYVDLKKTQFTRTIDFQLFFKFVYHYGILIWLYVWEGDMKHFMWESGKPSYYITYFLLSFGPFKYTEVTALVIISIHIFFTLFALLVCRKNWKYVIFILLIYESLDILFYSDLLVSNLASYFDTTESLKMYNWFHSKQYYKPFFIYNTSFTCFLLVDSYIALVQLIKLFIVDVAQYSPINIKCCRIRGLIFTIFTLLLTIVYRTISLTWLRVWDNKHNTDNAIETFFTYVIYNVSPFKYLTSYAIFCCIVSILFLIIVCLYYYYPNKQTYILNLFLQHVNIWWIFIQLSGFVYQYIKIIKDSDSFDRNSVFLQPQHLKPYLQFHIIFLIVLFFCSCVIIGYIYKIWREECVEEFVVIIKPNNNNNNNGLSNDTRVIFNDNENEDDLILLFTDDGLPVYIPASALIGTDYYYNNINAINSNTNKSRKNKKPSNSNGIIQYTSPSWEPCPGASPVNIPVKKPLTLTLPQPLLPPSLPPVVSDDINQNLIDYEEQA